jgi:hypothetical protein
LARLQDRPKALQEKIFTKLFEAAEIAKYSKQEQEIYEESLKHFRDLKNVLDTAKADGKIEVAFEMKKKGLDVKLIIEMTGLTEEEINAL